MGTIRSSQFIGNGKGRNKESVYGAILSRDRSSLTISDCLVKNNFGFGVHAHDGGKATVKNCQILANGLTGIYADFGGVIEHDECTFRGNKHGPIAKRSGGVVKEKPSK